MNMQTSQDEQIQEEALRWFARARATNFSVNEQQQLENWLEQDARHRCEYTLLHKTWKQVGELEYSFSRPAKLPNRRDVIWRPTMLALAAGAVIASVLLVYLYTPIYYEAPPGGHLNVQIADGIQVELDADSAIRVSRLTDYPDVRLTRGSAYFDVQASRSGLRVHVADVSLRDIGTRFAATVVQDDGQVAVAEGMVEVSSAAEQKMLGVGQQTHFSSDQISTPGAVDPQQIAPWRNGEYRFTAATLAEVADAIWRHSRLRIEIPDARIASLTVSGNFEIQQPEKLLWVIAQVHDLHARKLADGHYKLLPNS
jgi:transmembrane sensor